MRGRALSFFIAVVCCVGSFNVRADDAAQSKAKLEAIRKAGEPTTLAELVRFYPEPPAGQNAASLLTNAFAKFQTDGFSQSPTLPVFGNAKFPSPGTPLTPSMKSAIAQLLAKNQEALVLLHEGCKLKEGRYGLDFQKGFDMSLPHLTKLKVGAMLLELEAVASADDGRTVKAVEAIVDMLHLGSTLKNEPIIISQLVRIACNRIGVQALEWTLNRRALTDDQLRKLTTAFAEAETTNALSRACMGNRAFGIDLFQRPTAERKAMVENLEKFLGTELINLAEEDWEGDFNLYLDAMAQLVAGAGEVSRKYAGLSDSLAKRVDLGVKRKYFLTAFFVKGDAGGLAKNVADCARLHCAGLVIGIERYRREHQYHAPDTLEQLIPGQLSQIPQDPFSEGPLKYTKRADGGYTVSSAGTDANKPIEISVK